MSSDARVQYNESSNQWKLALLLAGHNKMHEKCLKLTYQGMIQELELQMKMKLETGLVERVWSQISTTKLAELLVTFISAFCTEILGTFSEIQVSQMLSERKTLSAIKDDILKGAITTVVFLKKEAVEEVVASKATAMTTSLADDMVSALRKEGINIPEKKAAEGKPVAQQPANASGEPPGGAPFK